MALLHSGRWTCSCHCVGLVTSIPSHLAVERTGSREDVPRTGRSWPRLAKAENRLLDYGAPRVCVRDFGANDREARLVKDPERCEVVTGRSGIHGPDCNDIEEEGKGLAGHSLSPNRPVDPVGQFRFVL